MISLRPWHFHAFSCRYLDAGWLVFGRFLSFFVSLSAILRENGWADLHEIFREGVEWPWDDLIKFWVNSGKRSAGQRSICLLSPAIAQGTGVNKSVSFARWQQRAGFVVPRTTACYNFTQDSRQIIRSSQWVGTHGNAVPRLWKFAFQCSGALKTACSSGNARFWRTQEQIR